MVTRFRTLVLFIVFLLAAMQVPCAFGASSTAGKGFFGPIGGLAFPSTSSAAFVWGFHGFYKITNLWAVGPFYLKYGVGAGVDDATGSANVDSSSSLYGAEASIPFSGSLSNFIVGMKIGLANIRKMGFASSTSTLASIEINESSTYFFFAPKVAYDYPVGRFSFGGELDYIRGIGSFSPVAVLFLGAVKFWF